MHPISRALLLAPFALCALGAQAMPTLDDLSTTPHRDWLTLSGLSHHFQPDRRDWREANPGAGFEREFTGTPWVATAGYFRNSYDRNTFYLGGRWVPLAAGPFRFGAFGLYKDRYRVSFYPFGKNPFWLSRKAKHVANTYFKNREHILERVEPCESVPVRCLGVENESNSFLAGSAMVPTHNTFAVALINHLDMIFKPGCEIASAGAGV